MRPSNERHPGSERGLQRVCAPLRYVSSGAQVRAKSRKVAQGRRVPGLLIMCCAGFSCVGCQKLAYPHGSFGPRELKKVPMGTRDLALRVKILPMGTREKKRKPRQMMASCSPKLRSDPTFSIGLFSPLGPHSGSGAVPRTPALPGYCGGIAGT